MSNLFIGFPVPRAKIADMITGAAPPLNHVANHLPDGSDPIVLPGDIENDEVVQWNGSKFIGTAAPADGGYPSPISIPCTSFSPSDDSVDFQSNTYGIRKRTTLDEAFFSAPVFLPHGVTVTKFTIFAYLMVSGSIIETDLYRCDHVGGCIKMATCDTDWTDGYDSKYDDSISQALIDNVNYSYSVGISITPNTSEGNAKFLMAMIDFTS